jgi:enoyl-CoA hydratase/carnithine racemase
MNTVWADESGEPPAVLTEVRDGVAVVTLNRPKRLNAWTTPMGILYFDALEKLAHDPAVRAILVTGQGRAFCAGADTSGLANIASLRGDVPREESRPYWLPMSIGKPIVAAIRGACYGVGFQQALCCDVRIASDDVKFSAVYAKRGLIGEVGIVWNLTRIVGAGAAMDFMISGRVVGAKEALRVGLATRVAPVDDLMDEAMLYCQALARENSPWSMRMIKQQVYNDLMSTLPAAYERSEGLLEQALAGEDFAEGIAAFTEKRPTAFPPLAGRFAKVELPTS